MHSSVLAFAYKSRIVVSYSMNLPEDVGGFFDPSKPDFVFISDKIEVNDNMLNAIILHELGHAWSFRAGTMPNVVFCSQEDYIREEICADLFSIIMMYQLGLNVSEVYESEYFIGRFADISIRSKMELFDSIELYKRHIKQVLDTADVDIPMFEISRVIEEFYSKIGISEYTY